MEFSNPSIFYYLALLAIPIIIHLFNFRRYKKVYFSSIYFLQEIQKTSNSKHQIRHWIILLNRLFIIGLIILAFALPQKKEKYHNHEASHIGIYLDNSFSMSRKDSEGVSMINYAKKNTQIILEQLKPTQKVLILTNDFEKKHQKWYSPKDAILAINSISVSGNTKNIDDIIKRYEQALDTSKINSMYIFSDFQKLHPVKEIKSSEKTLIKIGILHAENNKNNVSIDSCYFRKPIRDRNEIRNLITVLRNHSNQDVTINTQLIINKQKKSTHNIKIPKASSITHNFHYSDADKQNIIHGVIEINDQHLLFDNKLHFSYSKSNAIPICIIHENKTSEYLKQLFSDSLFNPKYYNVNQIEYHALNNNSLIILDQLQTIPKNLSKKLTEYIAGGNNLFVFPNQNSDLKSYNNFLNLVNTDLISQWSNENKEINYINYEHPIYQSVFNTKQKRVNLPKISGYFTVEKNVKSQNRHILSFLDESPFLANYLYKKGNIFICFSDLNVLNNNFMKHALFVPTLYNAALINDYKHNLYELIEDETIIEASKIKKDDIVHLKKDDSFDMIPNIIHQSQNTLINFENTIKEPGNYMLEINDTITMPLSFNYNRIESNMQFLTSVEIKNMLSNDNVTFILNEQSNLIGKDGENQKRNRLEYIFIISAIILLIIEVILLRIWKT